MPDNPSHDAASFDEQIGNQIRNLIAHNESDVRPQPRAGDPGDGPDIEVPVEFVSKVGFRYAAIRPRTEAAYSAFAKDLERWNLPEPVLAITYDREGNIYYGFPWGPLGLPQLPGRKRKFWSAAMWKWLWIMVLKPIVQKRN